MRRCECPRQGTLPRPASYHPGGLRRQNIPFFSSCLLFGQADTGVPCPLAVAANTTSWLAADKKCLPVFRAGGMRGGRQGAQVRWRCGTFLVREPAMVYVHAYRLACGTDNPTEIHHPRSEKRSALPWRLYLAEDECRQ